MKKLLSVFCAVFAIASARSAYAALNISDGETLRFDLGAKREEGYISVSAYEGYTPERGYGFANMELVTNDFADGDGALSDSVIFKSSPTGTSNTFNADLPEGLYNIRIYAGNIARMSVDIEGHYAIMNMTSHNCAASVEVEINDGQLNLAAVAGKADTLYSISAVEITKIPWYEERRKRVFIAGDSITSTYYPLEYDEPLDTGCQGGWGQMLENYIPESLYVHNYATGGQCARGFLRDGQFDAVEYFMRPGDYVMIGFGINDQADSNEEEFYACMTEMVERVKVKGGVPIIFTTQGRLTDFNDGGLFYVPDRWYKSVSKRIAAEQGAAYIDLHDLSSAYFTALGRHAAKQLFWINWSGEQDTLHSCREGAGQMARLIAEELCRQGFKDFEGNLYDYGVSTDITLKISGVYDGNLLNIQNLSPETQTVDLLVNMYNSSGALMGAKVIHRTFDAYDVLNPLRRETVILDESCTNCKAYLLKDGRIQDLNGFCAEANFSVPYNTAAAWFGE